MEKRHCELSHSGVTLHAEVTVIIENARAAEAIFIAVLELATLQERAAYLEGICAGKAELRERVLELLAAHQQSRGSLDSPPSLVATVDLPPLLERPGMAIGPYKLFQHTGWQVRTYLG